jgi:hypothetical protein
MGGELSKMENSTSISKFLKTVFLFSLYRNAVRTDAGEGRTVPHTVLLRGGAMQRDACAYCLWKEIILTADAGGD